MKTIELTHSFTYRASEISRKNLSEASSLKQFAKILVEQSNQLNPDRYDPFKYRGDGFEWFAEFFFKYFDGDNLFLNVTDYQLATTTPDHGVDGVGKYSKDISKVVCLQHKFKSNTSKKLSSKEDNLSNFGVNAFTEYLVERNKNHLIVFTNASGITRETQEGIFNGCVTCIDGEIISRYIDSNQAFWDCFGKTVSKVST